MARKHDPKAVREAVGALTDLGVPTAEIHRRLREDECGIGYRVDIGRRAVNYHRARYREEKARASTTLDTLTESIAATKQLAVDLLRRELLAHESKRAGSMTAKGAKAVEYIHKALSKIEKAERSTLGRTGSNGNGKSKEAEEAQTAVAELARAEIKRQGEATVSADEPLSTPASQQTENVTG